MSTPSSARATGYNKMNTPRPANERSPNELAKIP
ncbi:hypothetical protein T11_8170 [Trichinella zimbabwensis]|uniref:Uncharacterized protein n=1 Tax=Trichinella zimbabwensis TaxID=268475 RepID=A0A0V1G5L6_9BILA|nr:hypothetical protein T11_8170 [Trichinella zimbabwensis]